VRPTRPEPATSAMARLLPVICPPFCAKPGAIFGSGETDYVDLNQSTSPGQFVSSTRITGSARPKQANPGQGYRLRWLRELGSAHLKCGIRDSDTRLRQRRHSGSVADAAGIAPDAGGGHGYEHTAAIQPQRCAWHHGRGKWCVLLVWSAVWDHPGISRSPAHLLVSWHACAFGRYRPHNRSCGGPGCAGLPCQFSDDSRAWTPTLVRVRWGQNRY